ncbi:MAG: PocR ligand-binding domain-containing protein [Pseudomonadota bacterium]
MKLNAMVLDENSDVDWISFERSLAGRFGVNAVTFRGDGGRRTPDDGAAANDICRLIRSDAVGFEMICGKVQRIMNQSARIKKRGVAEECLAGMFKIVFPVMVADAVDGFVSVCGRPYYSLDRIYTEAIARTIGEDEARIRGLLATLVPIDARTIKAISRHIAAPVR